MKKFKLYRHTCDKEIRYLAVFDDCYAITGKGFKTWTVFNGSPTHWFKGSIKARPSHKRVLSPAQLVALYREVNNRHRY